MSLHTCYVAPADTRNSEYGDEEITTDMIFDILFSQSFTV